MKPSALHAIIQRSGYSLQTFLDDQIASWAHLVPNGSTVTGSALAETIWRKMIRNIPKSQWGQVPWHTRVTLSYHLFNHLADNLSVTRLKKSGVRYNLKEEVSFEDHHKPSATTYRLRPRTYAPRAV